MTSLPQAKRVLSVLVPLDLLVIWNTAFKTLWLIMNGSSQNDMILHDLREVLTNVVQDIENIVAIINVIILCSSKW